MFMDKYNEKKHGSCQDGPSILEYLWENIVKTYSTGRKEG